MELSGEDVRRLAAGLLEHAVNDAMRPPGPAAAEAARAAALDFLRGPRCEFWCAALELDPEAMRERLQARIEGRS